SQLCTYSTPTAGPLNLSGGSGPFYSGDAVVDYCGDLLNGTGSCQQSVKTFDDPITVPCNSVGAINDGNVHMATCLTWGNQDNEVGNLVSNNNTCDDENELQPGTKAKCNCQDSQRSTVPLPNLQLSCGCTQVTGSPNSSDCTVAYT